MERGKAVNSMVDELIYCGKRYVLLGKHKEMVSSQARFMWCVFEVDNGILYLKKVYSDKTIADWEERQLFCIPSFQDTQLDAADRKRYLKLQFMSEEAEERLQFGGMYRYADLQEKIAFSGRLLIGGNPYEECLGEQESPWNYRSFYGLWFEEGQLVREQDWSEDARSVRQFLDRINREYDREMIGELQRKVDRIVRNWEQG